MELNCIPPRCFSSSSGASLAPSPLYSFSSSSTSTSALLPQNWVETEETGRKGIGNHIETEKLNLDTDLAIALRADELLHALLDDLRLDERSNHGAGPASCSCFFFVFFFFFFFFVFVFVFFRELGFWGQSL
jgi:hypothetical protein